MRHMALIGSVRQQHERRREAGGRCREQQVLDCAAEADVHLAKRRIDAADVARAVGEHVDAVTSTMTCAKAPRLRVVRIRGEDRCAHELQR